jgi:hypothetical protein
MTCGRIALTFRDLTLPLLDHHDELFPFSTTYVASSAPLPAPTFFALWIVPAGMNKTVLLNKTARRKDPIHRAVIAEASRPQACR